MKNPFRRFSYWLQTLVYSALMFFLLSLVFLIASPFQRVYDLSSEKRFSLDPLTREVLRQFQTEKVDLIGFFKKDAPALPEIESLLPSLKKSLFRLTFTHYDLEQDPDQARKYGIHEQGVLLVEAKGRRSIIPRLDAEGFRRAFEKLSDKSPPRILFLKGHGEVSLEDAGLVGYSFVKDRLANESYLVQEDFAGSYAFAQADLVIVSYPKEDLATSEVEALKKFLETKSAMFMIDPEEKGVYPNLQAFLSGLGAELGNNVVLDRSSRLYGADDLIAVITQFTQHPIVKGFDAPLFLPLTRSVRMSEAPGSEKWNRDYFIFSGKDSWGETSYSSLERGTYAFSETEDDKGPLALALAVQRKEGPENRVLVFGDSDLINNTNFNAGGNRLLFLNSIRWLLKEKILSRRGGSTTNSQAFVLSPKKQTALFWGVALLPALLGLLFLGGFFFLRRIST